MAGHSCVTPDVLIPRPETEHLIEAALPHCAGTVIDVGCGSGAIALTLALESSRPGSLTTDISERALRLADRPTHKPSKHTATLIVCDLLSAD